MPNDQQQPHNENQGAEEDQLQSRILLRLLNELLNESEGRKKKADPTGFGTYGSVKRTKKREIDLVEFFYRVLVNLHYVVIAAVVCAVLAGLYAGLNVTPLYMATSKLYVVEAANGNAFNISDFQLGNYLTMDYQEVFKTWEVHEMVRQELGLTYSYGQLQRMVTVSNPENTRVLYITVTNDNPQLAIDIANAFATAARQFIVNTMETAEPNVFSVALIPSAVASTTRTNSILMGFIIGSVLAMGIILIRLLLDDKPRTPEDITRYAGIPTMAVVPSSENGKNAMRDALKRQRR